MPLEAWESDEIKSCPSKTLTSIIGEAGNPISPYVAVIELNQKQKGQAVMVTSKTEHYKILETSLDGIEIEYQFKLSRDDEAKKVGNFKRINGTFVCNGLKVADAIDGKIRSAAIAWQGSNRPRYDDISEGQAVKIQLTAPGRKFVDNVKEVSTQYAATDTDEDKMALLLKVTGGDQDELDRLLGKAS